MLCAISYHLHNLKNVNSIHGGVLLLLKLQACKETHLQRRFSRFLNCRNGTKSCKTSHIIDTSRVYYSKY